MNPATGERQLTLIGEAQEIQMGREADQEISASLGLYADEAAQRYVSALGQELAAKSERPDLPWSFKVVDDPIVNAFALPGGFIYVTRGIMAHLSSEAELVAVLGHEIGHVTGRHSVERLSKAQLANVGLGVGMIVSPRFRQFGDLAQMGMGLLFLKYSRDDEREACATACAAATTPARCPRCSRCSSGSARRPVPEAFPTGWPRTPTRSSGESASRAC